MTPLQAYEQHLAALAQSDLDALVAGYSDDAVFASNAGIGRGHAYIRDAFAQFLGQGSDLQPRTTMRHEAEIVHVTWDAGGEPATMWGADTFVVRDGLIVAHTGFIAQAG